MVAALSHSLPLIDHRAIKNGKGLHSKKEVPIHRVADISGVRWISVRVWVGEREMWVCVSLRNSCVCLLLCD